MLDLLTDYSFLQNAVIGAFLASIVCGIIGTIIIEKKLVMMSGGIAHTSFGGIGLGFFLNVEPIYSALLFTMVSAIAIVKLKKKTETNSDTLIGIFWATGMALGILFISFTPGYPPQIASYLFGDILTITDTDVVLMILLVSIVSFTVISLFNYWKAYLFDEEFLQVIGVNAAIMEYMLFIIIALTIVVLIRVVGIILVIALLTTPPAIARFFTYNLKKMMIIAVIIGFIISLAGLWLSYQFDIASGASIIILAGITYMSIAFKLRYNI